MRLLNTTTLEFEEFIDTKQVEYSILSHCWSQDREDPEVTHQAYLSKSYDANGAGYQKILRCCKLSKEQGLEYTWIDTCCVDKTSSAELSETINSMFQWYWDSAECYVFMNDMVADTLPEVEGIDKEGHWEQGLQSADVNDVYGFVDDRWFSRCWTLQELLAPRSVLFYNRNARFLGTKSDLAPILAYATGIHTRVIMGLDSVYDASVAQRMSWASARQTTRPEDMAYSLLGLFDVNMPLLYGEGGKAFTRLQEAIIRQSYDQSIFAWRLYHDQGGYLSSVLAAEPHAFLGSGNIICETQLMKARRLGTLKVSSSQVSFGYGFMDMVSFDAVKGGLEIRHRNLLAKHHGPGRRISLTLNCFDVRSRSDVVNLRLDLQMTSGGWRRAGTAPEDIGFWKSLGLPFGFSQPSVLYASLHQYNPFDRTVGTPRDHPALVWTWTLLSTLFRMIPVETLMVIAFTSSTSLNLEPLDLHFLRWVVLPAMKLFQYVLVHGDDV
ncbi:hypothetical protein LTR17_019734 [Elasticomyces elasticus]|nr:hypothetical protein LTR17_019734 [Elasticomyces elasticus]